MGTLALILVPACAFVAVVAIVLAYRRGRALEPERPWWGRPGVWIGLSMVFVLVGVFAFPRLLGFTFLFFPFVVMRSVGRGPRGRRP
jgi:hypothetical protein